MKSKLPWMLLLVSVCFNVFFVAGFIHARRTMDLLKTDEGRIQLIGERLSLDEKQWKSCREIAARREKALAEFSGSEAGEAFWAELLKDQPDRAKIDKLLESRLDAQRWRQSLEIGFLLEFLKTMTPDQRARCIRILKGRNLFAD